MAELSERVLEGLRLRKENSGHVIGVAPAHAEVEEWKEMEMSIARASMSPFPHTTSRFSQTLHRLHHESANVPTSLTTRTHPPLFADGYTLTTYITHLTSTGNPHIIPSLLFYLLPELSIIDHPSYGSLTPAERKQLRVDNREMSLRRAVGYGPWGFCVLLNALRKAGKTGLAERVWLLAKEAERASWIPKFWTGVGTVENGEFVKRADVEEWKDGKQPKPGPWCLPVQAYTTMIQCYTAEALRGHRACKFALAGDECHWQPRSGQNPVRGWAGWFLKEKERDNWQTIDRRRLTVIRRMGKRLVRDMRKAARAVYESLLHVQQHSHSGDRPQVRLPYPDARFFNAALSIYMRQPNTYTRGARTTHAHWRRKSRLAEQSYAKAGLVSRYWHPWLQEVVMGLVQAGWEVPVGLHWLFVGRGIQWMLPAGGGRKVLHRRPYAFPRGKGKVRPHALPTVKERGLPRAVEGGQHLPCRKRRRVGRPNTAATYLYRQSQED
jgi:hypothetical protein